MHEGRVVEHAGNAAGVPALRETIKARIERLSLATAEQAARETAKPRIKRPSPATTEQKARETAALQRLDRLAAAVGTTTSAKYAALVAYLTRIGVAPGKPVRAVVFAERVPTLLWLRGSLVKDLRLKPALDEINAKYASDPQLKQQKTNSIESLSTRVFQTKCLNFQSQLLLSPCGFVH